MLIQISLLTLIINYKNTILLESALHKLSLLNTYFLPLNFNINNAKNKSPKFNKI
jgi:hypothetical protein